MAQHAAPSALSDGILLGAFDVHLKGASLDCTLPARFFHNYQKDGSVWAEVVPAGPWLAGAEVEVSSPGHLRPFPAVLGSLTGKQQGGSFSLSAEVLPLRVPIEAAPVKSLREVTFALLDYPISGNLIPDLQAKVVTFPCGQFDVTVKDPTEKHFRVPTTLGLSPHTLSNSGILTERDGRVFSSDAARIALDNVHDTLSFAAGRWVGITFVEASDASGAPAWFRWGTSRMSPVSTKDNWHDPRHPEWLAPLCIGLLGVKAVEETWDVIRTALYWYMRSNTRGAGIDSSLILSQCALELLSWFVIVKRTGALSEEGYGQLNNASEKLRLALTLLGIPRQIPTGLKKVVAVKEWRDVADAIVQARNYLVHPTQSRSGKRRAKRDYPGYELWTAAQWLLELVILRLVGYSGNYRNRTELKKFDAVERVPWA